MTKYKVELDKNVCIGCRACTVACNNFVMKGSTAEPVRGTIDQSEFKANSDAEEGCPVTAIKITKISD